MLHLITQKDINEAIDHLANEIPSEILIEIYMEMQVEDVDSSFEPKSLIKSHLQEAGFEWNDAVFEDLWARLVKKATQKIMRN